MTEAETGMAANALADRLIDGMGFDPLDMASMIAPQLPFEFRDDGPLFAKAAVAAFDLPALAVELPPGKALPPLVQDAVTQGVATLSTDGVRQRVQLRGAVADALGEALVAAQKGKQRAQVAQQIERHNALVAGTQAPANRGDTFVPVPRLGYRPRQGPNQGELLLLERDAVLETVDLNLLAQPVALAGFTLAEQGTQWALYLDGQKLRVGRLRDQAAKAAFTQLVLDGGWEVVAGPAHEFRFDPAVYPVPGKQRYQGKFRFSKQFYPVLADLQDGSEEWRCAMALDAEPRLKHWVRNLDCDPVAGFWLPTSFGRFYPDFVCQLTDGRVLVAEYKGDHLRAVSKEIEKRQVGAVWAAHSAGRAVFAMVYKQERGMTMAQQIAAALG